MKPAAEKDFANALKYLFRETFEGSPPKGSIYLDRGVGVFNTIANLDAETASRSIAGASIAAHTEHLRYYLEVLSNFLQGIVQGADWNKGWRIRAVTEEEWKEIKKNLRQTYSSVDRVFKHTKSWDQDKITEAMAIVVHTAYHLGAIRQIVKTVNREQKAAGGQN